MVGNKYTHHRKDYRLIKVTPGLILNTDLWDYKTPFDDVVGSSDKYQSIIKHFRDGVPWLETDLFQVRYHNRLEKGEHIYEIDNLKELAFHYESYYDTMFEDLKNNGVKSPNEDKSIDPILVDIDKDGNICYTLNGNHRLAMLIVL